MGACGSGCLGVGGVRGFRWLKTTTARPGLEDRALRNVATRHGDGDADSRLWTLALRSVTNASRHWLVCAQAAITLRSRRRSGSMRPSASVVAPPSGGGASVHLAHERERVLPLRLARARRDLAVVAHEIRPARAAAAHSSPARRTVPPSPSDGGGGGLLSASPVVVGKEGSQISDY